LALIPPATLATVCGLGLRRVPRLLGRASAAS
jgi:hypothetical protein